MSVEDAADRLIARECVPAFDGFGVISTDSPIARRLPKRKWRSFQKEQDRLSRVASEAIECLCTAGANAARARIADANLSDSIVVTVGRDELARAIARRFRERDNAWAIGFSDERLFTVYLWHDPTHRVVT